MDLLERRHTDRNEPKPLAVLVACRKPVDWLDRLVSLTLPRLIVDLKASASNGVPR